jgi:hypothetical protein
VLSKATASMTAISSKNSQADQPYLPRQTSVNGPVARRTWRTLKRTVDPKHVILYTSNGEVRQEFSIEVRR